MTLTKFGSFEQLLSMAPESLQPILVALKEIIIQIHPDAIEVVRLGDRAATYGVGPKKMTEGYVYILPYKSWVNLGFYRGSSLEDPSGLLEGTGKNMRHVKIRSVDMTANAGIKDLIYRAFEERSNALGYQSSPLC